MSSGIASALENPGFPTTREACERQALMSNGGPNKKIRMKNICISDLTIDAVETVVVNSNQPNNFIPLLFAGVFGVLAWEEDAINPDGTFAPNAFIQAQAFVARIRYQQLPPPVQATFPPNTLDIFDSILTSNSDLFFLNVRAVPSGPKVRTTRIWP